MLARLARVVGIIVMLTSLVRISPAQSEASMVAHGQQTIQQEPQVDYLGINNIVKGGTLLSNAVLDQARADLAAQLGAGWNRVVLWWFDVEPFNATDSEDPPRWEPQNPDVCPSDQSMQSKPASEWLWNEYDTVVDRNQHNGFKTLFVLQGVPACWQQGNGDTAPLNIAEPMFTSSNGVTDDINQATGINPRHGFANYVYQSIARYGDRVHHWQIWNEVNSTVYWNPQNTNGYADYARMVEVTYWVAQYTTTLHNHPPVTLVLSGLEDYQPTGALNTQTVGVLQGLAANSALSGQPYLNYTDIWAAHKYNHPWRILEYAHMIRSWIQSNVPAANEDTPFWITEFGTDNSFGGGTQREALRGASIVQSIIYMTAVGRNSPYLIDTFFQFQLDNTAVDTGLLDNTGMLREAYTAVDTWQTYLHDATPTSNPLAFNPPTNASTVQQASFTSPRYQHITALWAVTPQSQTINITAQGSTTATLIWQDGTSQTLTAANGVYTLTLPGSALAPAVGGEVAFLLENPSPVPTPSLQGSALPGENIIEATNLGENPNAALVIERTVQGDTQGRTASVAALPFWLELIDLIIGLLQQYTYVDTQIDESTTYCYRARIFADGLASNYSNEVCLAPTEANYPYGIESVTTVPTTFQGTRDIPALFDGIPTHPNYGVINFTPGPIGVELHFYQPTTLDGFTNAIGGQTGVPQGYSWQIEADIEGNGTYETIVANQFSDAEQVVIPFPEPVTAKAFRITHQRFTGDNVEHIREITPNIVPPDADSSISGTAYIDSVSPANRVAGAIVQACIVGSRTCRASETDNGGAWSIENLRAGTYTLIAYPPADSVMLAQTLGPLTLADGATLDQQQIIFERPTTPPPGTSLEPSDTNADDIPVVHWGDSLTLETEGCPGATATWKLLHNGIIKRTGLLTEGPTGHYSTTLEPLQPLHGLAEIQISLACPDGSNEDQAFNLYIDPSGYVRTVEGEPIVGATVELYYSANYEGPFTLVPDGSIIMSPMNRTNPDTTNEYGHFGWDVLAGYYFVRASKAGCSNPENSDQVYVESEILTIPPPVTNLDLRLDCPEPEPAITQFTLIDPTSDQSIANFDPLISGSILNLIILPDTLNIRAEGNELVGSVRFELNGVHTRTENVAPYAFAGDTNGNYESWWRPEPGTYTLTAIPFSEAQQQGVPGQPFSITFTVVEDSSPLKIASFSLINAETDQPIPGFDPIQPGSTISLAQLPTQHLNIRANPSHYEPASVAFMLNTIPVRTENMTPFALAGDDQGDYMNWTPRPGHYTLEAIAYPESNAEGSASPRTSIEWTITE